MGNVCGGDIYNQIKSKYGSQFIKFIVTRNSINVLDKNVEKAKRQIQEKVTNLKQQKIVAIDSASAQILQNFTVNKKILEKKVPGGLTSLEKVKKAKTQQLMGFTFYKQKLAAVKMQTNQKFSNISTQLLAQIDEIHKFHRTRLVEDQPNLVIYNQLPQQVQKGIFAKGLQQYREQVTKSENNLKKSFGNKLDANYHIEKIQNILPQQSIDGLVSLSKEKFENSTEILSAAPLKDISKIF